MFSESGTLPSAKSGTLANLVLCQIQGVPSPMSTRKNSMFHHVFKPFLSAKSGTLQSAESGTLPNLVLCQNEAVPSPMRTRENPMFHRVFHYFLSAKSGTLTNPRRAKPDAHTSKSNVSPCFSALYFGKPVTLSSAKSGNSPNPSRAKPDEHT